VSATLKVNGLSRSGHFLFFLWNLVDHFVARTYSPSSPPQQHLTRICWPKREFYPYREHQHRRRSDRSSLTGFFVTDIHGDEGMNGFPRRTWFHRITLAKSDSRQLLCLLAKEGITKAKLFPDYFGAVQALAERQLWDKSADRTHFPIRHVCPTKELARNNETIGDHSSARLVLPAREPVFGKPLNSNVEVLEKSKNSVSVW